MNTRNLSKFLSLLLRHQPDILGVNMDAQGWVSVEELLEKMKAKGQKVDRAELEDVVANNSKKRFAFSIDGTKIRANQGHSVSVDLGFQPEEPPVVLFHGTARKFLDSIMEKGLQKQSRQHVHLSKDKETAIMVGKRHGQAVVLEILAKAMHQDGYEFYHSENGYWLTDQVPPIYFKIIA